MIDREKSESNNEDDIKIDSLKKITKGTSIVLFGSVIGVLFRFLGRTIFARFYSPAEYGIFSLGFTILTIFSLLGTLGLKQGATRQISYYLGKNEPKSARSVILLSLILGLITGVGFSVIIYSLSEFLAMNVFDTLRSSLPLKVFSIGIPFYTMIIVFISIFRGFESSKEKVYFRDFIRNSLFLSILGFFILLDLNYVWGLSSYVIALFITFILFSFYFFWNNPLFIRNQSFRSLLNKKIAKQLFMISLPLMMVLMLQQVMSRVDTLMLGFFKESEIVGFYNVARPLGAFISMPLTSMLFIFTPITSKFYAKNEIGKIKRNYFILTKWICSLTLPFMLILFLFPNIIIKFLFGSEYLPASIALRILSLGYFINNIAGPNGATLTAMARTRFLMISTFIATALNVILNYLLIPNYGHTGAAIASIISFATINFIRAFKLYRETGIHSIRAKLIKPIIISIITIGTLYIFLTIIINPKLWMLPIILIILILIYGTGLLVSGSFEEEDIEMIKTIEEKTNTDLSIPKKIIDRFQ